MQGGTFTLQTKLPLDLDVDSLSFPSGEAPIHSLMQISFHFSFLLTTTYALFFQQNNFISSPPKILFYEGRLWYHNAYALIRVTDLPLLQRAVPCSNLNNSYGLFLCSQLLKNSGVGPVSGLCRASRFLNIWQLPCGAIEPHVTLLCRWSWPSSPVLSHTRNIQAGWGGSQKGKSTTISSILTSLKSPASLGVTARRQMTKTEFMRHMGTLISSGWKHVYCLLQSYQDCGRQFQEWKRGRLETESSTLILMLLGKPHEGLYQDGRNRDCK